MKGSSSLLELGAKCWNMIERNKINSRTEEDYKSYWTELCKYRALLISQQSNETNVKPPMFLPKGKNGQVQEVITWITDLKNKPESDAEILIQFWGGMIVGGCYKEDVKSWSWLEIGGRNSTRSDKDIRAWTYMPTGIRQNDK